MQDARVETVRPAGAPVVPMAPMNPPAPQADDRGGAPIHHLREVPGEVAGEIGAQVRERAAEEVDERASRAGDWAAATADDLHEIAHELRDRGRDRPARIADMAGDGIAQAGAYLHDTDPDGMIHDLRDFARQQPLAFAAGAAILGLAVARVVRGSLAAGGR